MKDIILKLSSGEQIPLDDIYKFIRFVWEIDNPEKEYKDEITAQLFNTGYGQELIRAQYERVMLEPSKYGFEITRLLSKDNQLLKVYVKDIV